jgi:hypothetical protein
MDILLLLKWCTWGNKILTLIKVYHDFLFQRHDRKSVLSNWQPYASHYYHFENQCQICKSATTASQGIRWIPDTALALSLSLSLENSIIYRMVNNDKNWKDTLDWRFYFYIILQDHPEWVDPHKIKTYKAFCNATLYISTSACYAVTLYLLLWFYTLPECKLNYKRLSPYLPPIYLSLFLLMPIYSFDFL